MGDFKRRVPANVQELKENLVKLHQNASHVSKVWVDRSSGRLMVDLDWAANHMGNVPDFYMPVRKDKVNDAEQLAQRIFSQGSAGSPPSDSDAALLFSYIDPTGN